ADGLTQTNAAFSKAVRRAHDISPRLAPKLPNGHECCARPRLRATTAIATTKSCVRPVRREMAFCPRYAVNGKVRLKRRLRQAFGRSIYELESCSQQLEAPCRKCFFHSAWEWAGTWALALNGGVGFIFKIWWVQSTIY